MSLSQFNLIYSFVLELSFPIVETCIDTSKEEGSSSIDYHKAFFVHLHYTDYLDDGSHLIFQLVALQSRFLGNSMCFSMIIISSVMHSMSTLALKQVRILRLTLRVWYALQLVQK